MKFFLFFFFFFFQAEDGIRDIGVTGVQTCALPIYGRSRATGPARRCRYARRCTPRRPRAPDRREWPAAATTLPNRRRPAAAERPTLRPLDRPIRRRADAATYVGCHANAAAPKRHPSQRALWL